MKYSWFLFSLKSTLNNNSSKLLAGTELNNDNMKISFKNKRKNLFLLNKTIRKAEK
jgi:hypothetical protein